MILQFVGNEGQKSFSGYRTASFSSPFLCRSLGCTISLARNKVQHDKLKVCRIQAFLPGPESLEPSIVVKHARAFTSMHQLKSSTASDALLSSVFHEFEH
jgi:hypothetical protein